MTKQDHLFHSSTSNHWYTRPLIGDKSFLERIINVFDKPKVPKEVISRYQNLLKQIGDQASIAHEMHDIKFTNPEFICYIMLILYFKQPGVNYGGLANNYELLTVALATKNSFLKIEEIEFKFRGRKQQQFYKYVEEKLKQNLNKNEFNQELKQKITEIIPELMTEEGKLAIKTYEEALNKISDYNLGLKLLARFKEHEMSSFIILIKLVEYVDGLIKTNLQDLVSCELTVQTHLDIFERLGKIIEIPSQKNTVQTYAQMMQYITLGKKHEESYAKFLAFITVLVKWQELYQQSLTITKSYQPEKYTQPREFNQEIRGLELYTKYKDYLGLVSKKH